MKFTGFTSGCVGKALTVIFCILLGVVIAIGGEALAGYLLLTKDGVVGMVADKVNAGQETPILQFDEETKAKSVLSWGQEVLDAVTNLQSQEIGSIEKLIGMPIISETIADVIGVDAEKIKASTLDGIGKTVSDNLTLNNAKEQFNISLPQDIPLFNDAEFLGKPLGQAFENLTDHKLSEFIKMDSEANEVLKELGDVSIKDLQGATGDEKIKSMCLCQIVTINESSSKILKALKYCSIESQYTDETKTEYKTKTITETVDGVETEKVIPLIGINERIETLLVSEVVEINEDSNVILRKMKDRDLKVTELGGAQVTEIVNETKIGEIITVVETGENKSEPILIALKDTAIEGLNAKMKTLKLNEVFAEEKLSTGALSLIAPDTALADIPSEVTSVMLSATTATMKGKGLIDSDLSTLDTSTFKKEQKSFILNSNVGQMMKGLIDFVADPIDTSNPLSPQPKYSHITPHQATVSTASFASISDFVAAYKQFDTVTLATNVVVSFDANKDGQFIQDIGGTQYYCIPVFNAKTDGTAYTVTFMNGSTDITGSVRLLVYEYASDGVTLTGASSSQFAYAYFENVNKISGAYETVGEINTATMTE
ncbi:MAG: hypothetical protein ACI4SK_04635 [Christensenellales bacterium]